MIPSCLRCYRKTLPVLSVVALVSLAACSDDDNADDDVGDVIETLVTEGEEAINEALDDATETAIRNLAAEQGEEQFSNAGHPLDDEGLTCEAKVGSGGLNAVEVSCAGTTQKGGAAKLMGGTTEMPGASVTELEGLFAGTVDGSTVFEVEKLGG